MSNIVDCDCWYGDEEKQKELKDLIAGATLKFRANSNHGYGHHDYNEVWELPSGRYLHAECGGCSCGGSGHFNIYETEESARARVPEWVREEVPNGKSDF